jgi:hypothetical protein
MYWGCKAMSAEPVFAAAAPSPASPCPLSRPPVLMVCGFVMAWQQFYDEDKAEDEEEALA